MTATFDQLTAYQCTFAKVVENPLADNAV